jgi:hypothetical protein
MDTDKDIHLSLCWFDKEQWEHLAKIDPDGVDDSYEEWRKEANKAISNFAANGQKVEKVSIKVAELQEWCKNKGIAPNSSARAEFAAMLSQKRHEKKQT